MTGLLIKTDGTIEHNEYGEAEISSIERDIDCSSVSIKLSGGELSQHYIMFVDSEAVEKGLPKNEIGTVLQGTQEPVLGDIVLMKKDSKVYDISPIELPLHEAEVLRNISNIIKSRRGA